MLEIRIKNWSAIFLKIEYILGCWLLSFLVNLAIGRKIVSGQLLFLALVSLKMEKSIYRRSGKFRCKKLHKAQTSTKLKHTRFLNQAHAWFLEIDLVRTSVCVFACVCVRVCVCVCPPPRLLITSGVIWTPYDWLNKFYSCYMGQL